MNAALQSQAKLHRNLSLRAARGTETRALWLAAFRKKLVWRRAVKIGLPVGCIQSLLNQGDVWWHHEATGLTLIKTLLSPPVTFSVALIAAAGTWVEKQRSVLPTVSLDRTVLLGEDKIRSSNSVQRILLP